MTHASAPSTALSVSPQTEMVLACPYCDTVFETIALHRGMLVICDECSGEVEVKITVAPPE